MLALAVPVMLGFGVWQLQRMAWKQALLADLARNVDAPLLDLGAGPIPSDAQFRLVRLRLVCPGGLADLRAGRSLDGRSGWSYLAECRAGDEAVVRDAGWSMRPEPLALMGTAGPHEGRLVKGPRDRWILVDSRSGPPLLPSAPPGIETISNNHLSYALQWFAFAITLVIIYALWLRRWWLAQRSSAA